MVSTHVPRPEVGGVHHHRVVQLLQNAIREDGVVTSRQELLALNLPQQQQHSRMFWRNTQNLEKKKAATIR